MRFLTIFFILSLATSAYAEITFTFDQEEYYFKLGEDANIIMHMTNNGSESTGQLTYTINQLSIQQGMQQSYKETQSAPFKVSAGNSSIGMTFGKSEVEATLVVDFKYKDDNETIKLENLKVHFVKDEKQEQQQDQQQDQQQEQQQDQQLDDQNEQQQKKSESEQNQQQSGQQDPESQNQEQSGQPPEPKESNLDPDQQRLQNSQMNQDAWALQEQMASDMQKQTEMEQTMEDALRNDEDFQELLQNLTQEGYELKSKDYDSEENGTGEFDYEFENQDGDRMEVSGEIENNSLTDMQAQQRLSEKSMMQMLQQDERYKHLAEKLTEEGYSPNSSEFDYDGDISTAELTFKDDMNNTQVIKAEFENATVSDVQLEKKNSFNYYWLFLPLVVIAAILLLRKKPTARPLAPKITIEERVLRLLKKARAAYGSGEHKDAYSFAGRGLKLLIGSREGIDHELTNQQFLAKVNDPGYRKLLEACTYVEFAKGKSSEKEFLSILDTVQKKI